jgi:hypothetical protein
MLVNLEEFQRSKVGVVWGEGLASQDKSNRNFHAERSTWCLTVKAVGAPAHVFIHVPVPAHFESWRFGAHGGCFIGLVMPRIASRPYTQEPLCGPYTQEPLFSFR